MLKDVRRVVLPLSWEMFLVGSQPTCLEYRQCRPSTSVGLSSNALNFHNAKRSSHARSALGTSESRTCLGRNFSQPLFSSKHNDVILFTNYTLSSLSLFFIFVPCSILMLSKFSLFTNWCNSESSLKTILKFTLKQLPNSVYCRTVQHTDTNMDLIYAATPPPY